MADGYVNGTIFNSCRRVIVQTVCVVFVSCCRRLAANGRNKSSGLVSSFPRDSILITCSVANDEMEKKIAKLFASPDIHTSLREFTCVGCRHVRRRVDSASVESNHKKKQRISRVYYMCHSCLFSSVDVGRVHVIIKCEEPMSMMTCDDVARRLELDETSSYRRLCVALSIERDDLSIRYAPPL